MSQSQSVSGTVHITLNVNGQQVPVDVEPRWLLSDVLRHQLGLTGTHVGCEQGVCGACTVLVNGQPQRSCLMFAVSAEGAEITTIEGVTPEEGLSPLQLAFQKHHALQCGYCTPGFVLTAEALLKSDQNLDEATVREALSGNICRCTGYQALVDAVLEVSSSTQEVSSVSSEGSMTASGVSLKEER